MNLTENQFLENLRAELWNEVSRKSQPWLGSSYQAPAFSWEMFVYDLEETFDPKFRTLHLRYSSRCRKKTTPITLRVESSIFTPPVAPGA
jgi:hypothetical protein